MNIIKEISPIVNLPQLQPKIKSKVFEDNEGALKIAKAPSLTPRSKHFSLELHHFRSYVESGDVTVEPIDTREQRADILTKPISESLFLYLCKLLIRE